MARLNTRALFRIGLAVFLLLTLFWVKSHVEYLRERWAQDDVKQHWSSDKNPASSGFREPEDVKDESKSQPDISAPDTTPEPNISLPVEHDAPPVSTMTSSVEAYSQETASPATSSSAASEPSVVPGDKVIVMGKLEREDTSWVTENLPEWQHAIYTVDNSSAPLHTSVNKGKEANPYLTYVIDNYHNLPSTIVFLHSHRNGWPGGWHTDAPNYDNVKSAESLNIDFVQRNGYANLRCIHIPGCPDEVQPFREPRDETRTTEINMPEAWKYLFNNTDVPHVIATPCCAQFAVSKIQVLKRPLEDYVWYHKWLIDTPLHDDVSGRIFEYLWHIIFGQGPVYCPPLDQCYRDVYGRGI